MLLLLLACARHAPTAPPPPEPPPASPPGPVTWARGDVALSPDDPVLGSPTAPLTLVVFNDYQCPYCARMAPELARLAGPELRVVYKDYPLSSDCNPAVRQPFHQKACEAALLAECARQQGRHEAMSELLFDRLPGLELGALDRLHIEAGMDTDTMAACLQDPATRAAIDADVAAGQAAGVIGTPNLFLHGLYGDRWVDLGGFVSSAEALMGMRARGEPLPEPEEAPPR